MRQMSEKERNFKELDCTLIGTRLSEIYRAGWDLKLLRASLL